MQEEIHRQHTGLVHDIEEKKTIEKFGTKWVDHAKHKNACKVCARPFASPNDKEAFIQRFASVGCATDMLLYNRKEYIEQEPLNIKQARN